MTSIYRPHIYRPRWRLKGNGGKRTNYRPMCPFSSIINDCTVLRWKHTSPRIIYVIDFYLLPFYFDALIFHVEFAFHVHRETILWNHLSSSRWLFRPSCPRPPVAAAAPLNTKKTPAVRQITQYQPPPYIFPLLFLRFHVFAVPYLNSVNILTVVAINCDQPSHCIPVARKNPFSTSRKYD